MLGGHVGTCAGSCPVLALPVGRHHLGPLADCLEPVPHVEAGQSSFEPAFVGSVVAALAADVAALANAVAALAVATKVVA